MLHFLVVILYWFSSYFIIWTFGFLSVFYLSTLLGVLLSVWLRTLRFRSIRYNYYPVFNLAPKVFNLLKSDLWPSCDLTPVRRGEVRPNDSKYPKSLGAWYWPGPGVKFFYSELKFLVWDFNFIWWVPWFLKFESK